MNTDELEVVNGEEKEGLQEVDITLGDVDEKVSIENLKNAYLENKELRRQNDWYEKEWKPWNESIHENEAVRNLVSANKNKNLDKLTEKFIQKNYKGDYLKNKPDTAAFIEFILDHEGDEDATLEAFYKIRNDNKGKIPEFETEEEKFLWEAEQKLETKINPLVKKIEFLENSNKEKDEILKKQEEEKLQVAYIQYSDTLLMNEIEKTGIKLPEEEWRDRIREAYTKIYGKAGLDEFTPERAELIVEKAIKGLKKKEEVKKDIKLPGKIEVSSQTQGTGNNLKIYTKAEQRRILHGK
jgi:hypothetical protein